MSINKWRQQLCNGSWPVLYSWPTPKHINEVLQRKSLKNSMNQPQKHGTMTQTKGNRTSQVHHRPWTVLIRAHPPHENIMHTHAHVYIHGHTYAYKLYVIYTYADIQIRVCQHKQHTSTDRVIDICTGSRMHKHYIRTHTYCIDRNT